MIRLIPHLAIIAVLLWQPPEGWSGESGILLEPDAVLTGTGGYAYIGSRQTTGRDEGSGDTSRFGRQGDISCSFKISLKNYRYSQYLSDSNTSGCRFAGTKITLKFFPDGKLKSGKVSNKRFVYP